MRVPEYEQRMSEGDQARRKGEFAAAEAAYAEALAIAQEDGLVPSAGFARKHLPAAEVLCKLARVYQAMGRGLDATLTFRICLRIFSSVAGDEYFELALARDRRAVPVG